MQGNYPQPGPPKSVQLHVVKRTSQSWLQQPPLKLKPMPSSANKAWSWMVVWRDTLVRSRIKRLWLSCGAAGLSHMFEGAYQTCHHDHMSDVGLGMTRAFPALVCTWSRYKSSAWNVVLDSHPLLIISWCLRLCNSCIEAGPAKKVDWWKVNMNIDTQTSAYCSQTAEEIGNIQSLNLPTKGICRVATP